MEDKIDELIIGSDRTHRFPTSDETIGLEAESTPKRGRGRPRKEESDRSSRAASPSPKREKPVEVVQEPDPKQEEKLYHKLVNQYNMYKRDPVISKLITDIEYKEKEGLDGIKLKMSQIKARLATRFVDKASKNMFFGLCNVSEMAMVQYLKLDKMKGFAESFKSQPELWEVEVAEIGIDLFGGFQPSPYVRLAFAMVGYAQEHMEKNVPLYEDIEYEEDSKTN